MAGWIDGRIGYGIDGFVPQALQRFAKADLIVDSERKCA